MAGSTRRNAPGRASAVPPGLLGRHRDGQKFGPGWRTGGPGRIGQGRTFPGLTAERVRRLGDLPSALVAELLDATEAAAFFTRPAPPDIPTRPDTRTYHLCLSHGGRSRMLAVFEPYALLELGRLIGIAIRCVRG